MVSRCVQSGSHCCHLMHISCEWVWTVSNAGHADDMYTLNCDDFATTCAFIFPQTTMMKYILVTGGVISGIGKGIIASSVGTILKSCGLHVTAIKIDPYINIDAGTFSPYEHGTFSQIIRTRSFLFNRIITELDVLCVSCDSFMLALSRWGVRVGRRGWGGLGSGELWALSWHPADQRQQPDHRQDLSVSHQQGEEGRLPGQDGAG